MRIKKISNDKIVVQLTDTDLAYFDLDVGECVPKAADLHKFLFEVMELVQTETGFDPYHGGQVVVEATASANGMSLIISKIKSGKQQISREDFSRIKNIRVKSSKGDESIEDKEISDLVGKLGIARKKNHKKDSKNTVFVFDNFSDFETAVCMIGNADFSQASLYREGARYALVYSAKPDACECNIMSEYAAKKITNDVAAYSIIEGWTLVTRYESLNVMAENLRQMN